jgi:hypothetical protein
MATNQDYIQKSSDGTAVSHLEDSVIYQDDTNSRIGIGTTSPADLVHVKSGAVIVETSGNKGLKLRQNSSTDRLTLFVGDGSGYTADVNYIQTVNTPLHVYGGGTGTTHLMTIQGDGAANTGCIGIGVSNPSQKLEVCPDTDVSAKIGRAFIGYYGDSDYASFSHIDHNSASSYAFKQDYNGNSFINAAVTKAVYFSINNAYKMVLDTNGKVGIGTTSPDVALTVKQPSALSGLRIIESNSTDYYNIYNYNGLSISKMNSSDPAIYIANSSEVKVGIGQTAQGSTLSVCGNCCVGTRYAGDSAPEDGLIVEGSVGIGTTSPAASAKLEIVSTTGALLVPRMNSTQEAALTPVNGMIIYNNQTNKFRGYENGGWVNLI